MRHTHAPLLITLAAMAAPVVAAQPAGAEPMSPQAQANLDFARSLSGAFRHAAAVAPPSLVHVTSRTLMTQRDMFGRALRQELVNSGLGSGFVLSREGQIVTNNHVIAKSDDLIVRLADGREFPATILGADPTRDIAVLKIEASGLTPVALGDSDELAVGDWILALGSPFGLDSTVTAGIVSAKGRGISDGVRRDFEDYIQTDAAINPGNSGGPLIDLEGRVVGVNTAIFSRSGGSNGIGFAIPINLARAVAQDIIDHGYADRGWLGITMEPARGGVRVAEVLPESPAARAGLMPGDLITTFRGRGVDSAQKLMSAIALATPGTRVDLGVQREGSFRTLPVTLAARGEAEATLYGILTLPRVGLRVRTIDSAMGRQLPEAAGTLVLEVEPNTPADWADLKPGDVITAVDDDRVDSAGALESLLEGANLDKGVRLFVTRGSQRGILDLTTNPRRLIRSR